MPCNSCKLKHLIRIGLRIIKCINTSFHLSAATVIVLAQMLRKRTASSKSIAKTVDTSKTTARAD